MKVYYWLMMNYYDIRLDSAKEYGKRIYYFNKFIRYKSLFEK